MEVLLGRSESSLKLSRVCRDEGASSQPGRDVIFSGGDVTLSDSKASVLHVEIYILLQARLIANRSATYINVPLLTAVVVGFLLSELVPLSVVVLWVTGDETPFVRTADFSSSGKSRD